MLSIHPVQGDPLKSRCSEVGVVRVSSLISEMWREESIEVTSSPLFGLNLILSFLHLSHLTLETELFTKAFKQSLSPPQNQQGSPKSLPGEKEQQKGIWEQHKWGNLRLPGPTREPAFIEYLQPNILCVPLPTQPFSLVHCFSRAGRMAGEEFTGL